MGQIVGSDGVEILEVLIGNGGDGNFAGIQLIFLDEIKKEIERTFENLPADFVIGLCRCGYHSIRFRSDYVGCLPAFCRFFAGIGHRMY